MARVARITKETLYAKRAGKFVPVGIECPALGILDVGQYVITVAALSQTTRTTFFKVSVDDAVVEAVLERIRIALERALVRHSRLRSTVKLTPEQAATLNSLGGKLYFESAHEIISKAVFDIRPELVQLYKMGLVPAIAEREA